jgi:hypothetical protein
MQSNPGGTASGSFARLWQVGRLSFENNVIELVLSLISSGWNPPIGIDYYNGGTATPPTYLFAQVVIRRNLIHSLDGAVDGSRFPIGIRPWSCAKGVVEESIIDLNSSNLGPPVQQWQCGSMAYLNNQTSAGNLIQGYNNDTGTYIDEISTNVDLALAQSI